MYFSFLVGLSTGSFSAIRYSQAIYSAVGTKADYFDARAFLYNQDGSSYKYDDFPLKIVRHSIIFITDEEDAHKLEPFEISNSFGTVGWGITYSELYGV